MEPGPHQHTSILLLTTYLQLRAATSSKTRNSVECSLTPPKNCSKNA